MSNVLWGHHVDPHWDVTLREHGTSFDEVQCKIIQQLSKEKYDKVVITMFGGNYSRIYSEPSLMGAYEEHFELIEFCSENDIEINFFEYGYAWYRDASEDEEDESFPLSEFGSNWILGTRDYHDNEKDVLFIDDFQKEFKQNNDNVSLCGAFEDECLLDAETVLDHLNINWNKIQHLCVG